MRIPFFHRWLEHRQASADPGSATELGESGGSPLPADLTGPVVLLPAQHIAPQEPPTPMWWSRRSIVVASVIVVFALGTGTGIIVSKRGGGDTQSARSDTSLRRGVSALTLPDDDGPIDTAIRDSAGSTTVSRGEAPPAPVAARPERPPSDTRVPGLQPERAATNPPPESTAARNEVVDTAPSRGAESAAVPDTGLRAAVGQPAVSVEDRERAVPTPAPPPPVQDTAQAENAAQPAGPESTPSLPEVAPRPAARPALMAGVVRLIDTINRKRGEDAIRALLLDPASKQEVLYLVREQKPTVSLGTVDEVAIDGDEATLTLRVGFKWRGSFGVQEQETRRFEAVAEWDGTGWVFAGVRMLADVP